MKEELFLSSKELLVEGKILIGQVFIAVEMISRAASELIPYGSVYSNAKLSCWSCHRGLWRRAGTCEQIYSITHVL